MLSIVSIMPFAFDILLSRTVALVSRLQEFLQDTAYIELHIFVGNPWKMFGGFTSGHLDPQNII
jgi:hypothetical protein